MKRMYKVIAAAAVIFLGTAFAFAGEAEYDKLLAQAKEYESKKQWVRALSAYWDAMDAEPSRNGIEACKAFINIENAIEEGNPGLGEYDDFSRYDGWLELKA